MESRTRRAIGVTAAVTTGLSLTLGGTALAVAATGAATTTVNIRSGPSTSRHIEGSVVRGQRVVVSGKAKRGWVKVHFAGSKAYMASKYVDTSGGLPATPKRISSSGTKVVTDDLNVRTGPGTRYRSVGRLPEGSRLRLTGKQSHGFAKTEVAGHTRWVSVAYLAKAHGGAGAPSKGKAPVVKKPGKSKSGTKKPGKSGLSAVAKGKAVVAFAQRQLGERYVFGATGPKTWDCSGLTLRAWQSVGVYMPRTAHQQYAWGHRIKKSQLRAGDLVFFYTQTPRHVGIYVKNGRIIDAPGTGRHVRYTTLGHMPYSGAIRPR